MLLYMIGLLIIAVIGFVIILLFISMTNRNRNNKLDKNVEEKLPTLTCPKCTSVYNVGQDSGLVTLSDIARNAIVITIDSVPSKTIAPRNNPALVGRKPDGSEPDSIIKEESIETAKNIISQLKKGTTQYWYCQICKNESTPYQFPASWSEYTQNSEDNIYKSSTSKWQHKKKRVRMQAVQDLDNLEILSKISDSDPDVSVRDAARKRILSINPVYFENNLFEKIRAVKSLSNLAELDLVRKNEKNEEVKETAIKIIIQKCPYEIRRHFFGVNLSEFSKEIIAQYMVKEFDVNLYEAKIWSRLIKDGYNSLDTEIDPTTRAINTWLKKGNK